ncbi:MAG: cell division protein FtsQ/DivIB [Leucothrix sp.]
MAGAVAKKKRPQATRRKTVKQPLKVRWKPSININWARIPAVLLMIAPLLLVAAAYFWIQRPENLTITSVEVTGDLKYLDQDSLQPIIEPYVATNLFLLEAKELETELEFNSWIYSASLTKLWPDRLRITIHEERPIAFWGDDSMLNEFGEIIDAELPEKAGQLPRLFSPGDNGRNMVENYLKIQQWTKDFPMEILEFIEDSRGSWQLKLANGLTVNVGRVQQERRLRRFVVGYKRELMDQIKKIHTVDLRYTNGFAVKWKSAWQMKQDAKKNKG